MIEPKVLTIVIASSCALIGGIILWIGFIHKGRWLKTIGGALALMGIVSLFVNDEDFRAIMIGAATVIAALAATFALQQNTQLRQDTQKRELRDKKERLLDEIIEWASSIANVSFGHVPIDVTKEEDTEYTKAAKSFTGMGRKVFRYQALDTRSPYVQKAAEFFGEELHTAVLAVLKCRNNAGLCIDKRFNNATDESLVDELQKAEHELRNKALEVIRLAANAKVNLVP